MKTITRYTIGAALTTAVLIGANLIPEPAFDDNKNHCEMVQIYRESNGQYGWPDYNNTAHLCPEEK